MGATTVLPPSEVPRRCATADLHSCAPRVGVHPACMANAAAAKKPASPSSVRSGEPPAKRLRVRSAAEPRPSSVRGREPTTKRVGGAGERRLAAAADNTGSKKRPGSVRGGDPAAKRLRGVGEPHLAAAAAACTGTKKHPRPSRDRDPRTPTRLNAAAIKIQSAPLPRSLPKSTEEPKPSPPVTMSDLIKKALQAKARSAAEERRIELECLRADARRKREMIVATAEFNDPFIDPADVFMSRQQLREARQVAYAAQARIIEIEKARRREMTPVK